MPMKTPRVSRVACALAASFVFALVACERAHAMDIRRPEIRQFISRLVNAGLDRQRVTALLASAQSQQAIIDAMNKPAEKSKLWYEYRQIFLTESRIRDGAEFLLAHMSELRRAQQLTGVEPEYVVAILGVESKYGKQTGRYRVLDALATLAFDYPPRSKFFTDELEKFFALAAHDQIEISAATGSYAGAMGAPQFMPSSYLRFGVDGDGDGRVDLWRSWPDIFASIGNYFKENGWQPGQPAMAEASVEPLLSEGLDGRKFTLGQTVASLRARGMRFDAPLAAEAPAFAVAVDGYDGLGWRAGFKNFYVITRYNRSALYAMAAIELAAAVRRAAQLPQAPVPAPIVGAAVLDFAWLPRDE